MRVYHCLPILERSSSEDSVLVRATFLRPKKKGMGAVQAKADELAEDCTFAQNGPLEAPASASKGKRTLIYKFTLVV